jgi:hypothetical protein
MAVGFYSKASWKEHPQLCFNVRWHENSLYKTPTSLLLWHHIQCNVKIINPVQLLWML